MKFKKLALFFITGLLLFNCESESNQPTQQNEFKKSIFGSTNIQYKYREPGHILENKYMYSEIPKMVRYEHYDSVNGKIDLEYTKDYFLDDYGIITREIAYDYLDRLSYQSFNENVYDSVGNLIQTQNLYSTNRGIVTYEYNSDGTIKAYHRAYSDGRIISYYYNIINGGQTIEVLYFNTELNEYIVNGTFVFNENNKLEQYYNGSNSADGWLFVYKYDQNENFIEDSYYYQNEYKSSTYREYDALGRIIKTHSSNKDYYYVYEYSNDNFTVISTVDPFYYFENMLHNF